MTLSSLEHFLEAQTMKARYQAGHRQEGIGGIGKSYEKSQVSKMEVLYLIIRLFWGRGFALSRINTAYIGGRNNLILYCRWST